MVAAIPEAGPEELPDKILLPVNYKRFCEKKYMCPHVLRRSAESVTRSHVAEVRRLD